VLQFSVLNPYSNISLFISTISGTVTAIWSKTNFGPTSQQYPSSNALPRVYTFSRPAIINCTLKVVSCEGVQHRLRFYLDHISYAKIVVSSIENTQKVEEGQVREVDWVLDESHVVSGTQFLGEEEESVRW
jgi:hypothetical protein